MYRSLLRTPTQPLDRKSLSNSTGSTNSALDPSTCSCSTAMPPLDTPVTSPKTTVLDFTPRFSRFLADEDMPPQNFVHDHQPTPAEATVLRLRDARRRFANGTPADKDGKCAPPDRQFVLDVYKQALSTLSDMPEEHIQTEAECNRKVRVILGIVLADPDDPVFTTNGQLLKPLEPQYANPRLRYSEDKYGHLAQWRLNAWRKRGWPAKYPAEAVTAERNRGQQLVDETGTQKMKDGTMLVKAVEHQEMWEDEGVGYGGRLSEKEVALEWTRAQRIGREKQKGIERPRVETKYMAPSTRRDRRRGRNGDVETDIDDSDYEN